MTTEKYKEIQDKSAEVNLAVNGTFPPGSTFKILTTIAGLRRGVLDPERPIAFCDGQIMVGNKPYKCDVGHGHHGNVLLRDAIAQSCDVYYYKAGEIMTPEVLGAEGRRFHLNQPTGIELPYEVKRTIIPDPEWKLREEGARWVPGDTANAAIGQGYVLVTPLQMACFTASVARGQVFTKPTLLHDPLRPPQQNEPIGLTPMQRIALIDGMEGAISRGTGKILSAPQYRIPGIRLGGKTGTAQKRITKNGKTGNINLAWFICFAPIEKPEIAVAVMIEGDTIGEDFYGGQNAGPVVSEILKKYFAKKAAAARPVVSPLRSE
jgi:penicillin-binding protein 2